MLHLPKEMGACQGWLGRAGGRLVAPGEWLGATMTDSLEASSWYLGPAWVGEAQWQIWHGKVSSEALVEESWTQKRLLIAIGDKREKD